MCRFLSWIEYDKQLYYITAAELKSEKGKDLLKESGSKDDIWGHGFIRNYYGLTPSQGKDFEINEFNKFSELPKELKEKTKNLRKYFNLMFSLSGYLDVRGCALKGVTLPTSIVGYLDVRGCDLKGIALPTSIGGSLDVGGCDLKGVTLPKNIKIIK